MKIIKASLIAVVLILAFSPVMSAAGHEKLAIKNVTVIDCTDGPVKPNMTLIISDGKITALGKTDELSIPDGSASVEGRGKYLIPGLWDMHVHFYPDGEPLLPLFIANGITTVRDMGGDLDELKRLKKTVEKEIVPGPRIITPGPMFESSRWLGMVEKIFIKENLQITHAAIEKTRIGVDTPEEARQAVRSLAEKGVDFIKIRNCSTKEVFFALAETADQEGLQFVGHNVMAVSLKEAANAGQDSFEHNFFIRLQRATDEEVRDLIDCLKANGTSLVPTLVVEPGRLEPADRIKALVEDDQGALDPRRKYIPDKLGEFWKEQLVLEKFNPKIDWGKLFRTGYDFIRKAHEAGVKVMAGTDCGAFLVYPGFSLHDELVNMVDKVGMTPLEALRSATAMPAEFMGLNDSLGTAEPGKNADLVLLDENPLEDIRNTRKIFAVIARGKLFDREALRSMLDEAIRLDK